MAPPKLAASATPHAISARLRLSRQGSLRRALLAAFTEITTAGAEAAAAADGHAVHETRKALRRARAVIELARASLPPATRRELTSQLQQAHRSLSAARDAEVMGATLRDQLGDETPTALLVATEQAARELRAVTEPPPLASVARRLPALAALFERELGRVRWKDLEQALARALRRARGALKQAHDLPSLHTFRKRNKTVVYQLEFLASVGGRKNRHLRKHFAGLSESLGRLADLGAVETMLPRWLGHRLPTSSPARAASPEGRPADDERSPGGTLSAAEGAALGDALARRVREALTETLAEARDGYQPRPEALARKVLRRARRRR